MYTSFRQGILSYQSQQVGPALLQLTSSSTSSIDLVVLSNNPVVINFAHYEANYIVSENSTVIGAWGSGNASNSNGPLTPGSSQYLFWDINLATGVLSRGWTSLTPIYTSVAPTNPSAGQMWFDNVNTVWNVYCQSGSSPGVWVNKVRCFAGVYSSTITVYPLGSQVQPPIIGSFSAGNIILGTNATPLRNSDGTFVTTGTSLIIQETSGQSVSFDTALSFGEASESIPAFYLVSFSAYKLISLASNLNTSSFVSGIVTEQLVEEQVGQVITGGIVRYDQWSWSPSSVNAPLFCGPSGQVTLTPPISGVLQQVGVVYDTNAILLNIGPAVRLNT